MKGITDTVKFAVFKQQRIQANLSDVTQNHNNGMTS